MLKLEQLQNGQRIQGIKPHQIVTIIFCQWHGDTLSVLYRNQEGSPEERLLTREDEAQLQLATNNLPWQFDADPDHFKLALEAYRIQQAALFDPMMAIYTATVEPLPHQISAVYERMLPRYPLRFILADDPGAGKTIMAGLLVQELILRASIERILIVAPGSLSEQWQEELLSKFNLDFKIFSREQDEQAASGNFFTEQHQIIARLDQLARNQEELNVKLTAQPWDLVIIDEAHKLSAHYNGNKFNPTKRFKLGLTLSRHSRNFLLMTATPHNGKQEDFEAWLSLLDEDRFASKSRQITPKKDLHDIMRRMVKEDLLKFDSSRLFPERYAYTVNYQLSPLERDLYEAVTTYVSTEMNRIARKQNDKRKTTVGFALTQLQRRLASSPEAIYQSLKRRRKRLENSLKELQRGQYFAETLANLNLEEAEEELSPQEYEAKRDEWVDQATAADNIEELQQEIETLKTLEAQAKRIVNADEDCKWSELSRLLQETPELFNTQGQRRKLIIFTEHKDTLNYLLHKIGDILGNDNAIRIISGSTKRDDRLTIQEEFRHDPAVLVLIATDAAGEGVNLQNAHLMINYDLPWNPNRIEQRFGRIHRIGQQETCHLWNLVAHETREGDVFQRLFEKLEQVKQSLGGKVFDVLGEVFDNISLKELLIQAILANNQVEVTANIQQNLEQALSLNHIQDLLRKNSLVEQQMGVEDLYKIKQEMEKAEARKLQPYYIKNFFTAAFAQLKGELREREKNRFKIKHVPRELRDFARNSPTLRAPIANSYERVCFDKEWIQYKKSTAALLHPKHPLTAALLSFTYQQHQTTLKQGTVLLDVSDTGCELKVLVMLSHKLYNSDTTQQQLGQALASQRLIFVYINAQGECSPATLAPHLDLDSLSTVDLDLIKPALNPDWLQSLQLEQHIAHYATQHLIPQHYQEVKQRREAQAEKVHEAVRKRLIQEIIHTQKQHANLYNKIKAGQTNLRGKLADRKSESDQLNQRLARREQELMDFKEIRSVQPSIESAALVVPYGLLAQYKNETIDAVDELTRRRIEQAAMQLVLATEQRLGFKTIDVSADNCGWDISAYRPLNDPGTHLADRHLEVKGRRADQTTITVSSNEIHSGLNQGDKFFLVIVFVSFNSDGSLHCQAPLYIPRPFQTPPDPGAGSVNYALQPWLKCALTAEQSILTI